MLAMTLDTKNNQGRKNQGDKTLTRLDYKRYIKSNDYKSLNNKIRAERNISENLKKEIKEKVIGNDGEVKFVRNDFLKDLIIVRLNIRSQTGKDFLNEEKISEEEMKEILKIGKDNIEYNYFGEILKSQSKELNKVLAGFNSFAYTNNYIDIGNINVGLKNAVEFSGKISLTKAIVSMAFSHDLLKPPLILSCTLGLSVSKDILISFPPAFTQSSNCSLVAIPLVCILTCMFLLVNALTISLISFLTKGSPPINKTIATPIFFKFSAT